MGKNTAETLANHPEIFTDPPIPLHSFRHAFPQHTWTPRVCTGSSPWGAVLDNLLEPDRVKERTSSTTAPAGGECYITHLEQCCDLYTKLPEWSKAKQGSCTQQQCDTLSFSNLSPDSELMNLLAKTTTDYTTKNEGTKLASEFLCN